MFHINDIFLVIASAFFWLKSMLLLIGLCPNIIKFHFLLLLLIFLTYLKINIVYFVI